MSTKDTNINLESIYTDYQRTRAIHPSSDYEPLLRAANDTRSSKSSVSAQEIDMVWDDDEDSRELALLYKQWRSVSVEPGELESIRERVVANTMEQLHAPAVSNTVEARDAIDIDAVRERVIGNTMAVARVAAMNEQSAQAPAPEKKSGFMSKVVDRLGLTDRGLGLAPAGMSAAMVAAILMTALWNGAPDEPAGEVAAIAMIPGDIMQRADQFGPTLGAAIQASFSFKEAKSPEARAFGLGVGSVDLMMALQSGNAAQSAKAARGMLGLSKEKNWNLVNQSTGDVIDDVDSSSTISKKTISRSAALLDQIRENFDTPVERSAFELGRWIEMSFLTADLAARSGDTAVLTDTLRKINEFTAANKTALASMDAV